MAKKLVIFDFDGVLVDTNLACWQIHQESDPSFTYQDYKNMNLGNVHESVAKIKEDKKFKMPPDFWGRYEKLTCDSGMPEVLKETIKDLASKHTLTIVTSGATEIIRNILKRESVEKYFDEILGLEINKSKEIKFKKALEDHQVSPKDCVFITDTLGDILEANTVGIPSIAVSWGLHERSTFAPGNPAAIIDDPKDLVPTIERILA